MRVLLDGGLDEDSFGVDGDLIFFLMRFDTPTDSKNFCQALSSNAEPPRRSNNIEYRNAHQIRKNLSSALGLLGGV